MQVTGSQVEKEAIAEGEKSSRWKSQDLWQIPLRFVGLFGLMLPSVAFGAVPSFEKSAAPFLEKYCNRCHGEKKQKGDFRLDTLSRDFGTGVDTELWVEVMDRIHSGEMPPEDEPLPTSSEIEKVTEWLGDRIKEGELARMAKRPKVAHYRLSREEYAHTVYDLLGVTYDPVAPGEMKADPIWHGFQRIGSELTLSPSHVEKYLAAARQVLSIAYPDNSPKSRTYRKDALDLDWPNRLKREMLKERGVFEDVRLLMWPGYAWPHAEPAHINYNMPAGLYRARMQLSGLAPVNGRPPHVKLYCKQLDKVVFEQDILAPEEEPVIVEFETFLKGKISVKIDNAVPGPSNSGRAGRPTGQYVFTTLGDPTSRAPWQRKLTDDEGNALFPLLIFDWIEWEGPIVLEESVKKRDTFLAKDQDEAAPALRRFMQQAWRRPISDAELAPYLGIVDGELKSGAPFPAAYKTAMLAVLTSKNFYYLAEGSPHEDREKLNAYELASRLSYFLWSSMPDAELLDAAKSGDLTTPEGLRRQLYRMLETSQIHRFTDSFPRQWLQLDRVGEFPPDSKLYPDYDKWLEQSMVLETTGYFAEVFAKNLSVAEFLDSDWTMVNPRLALHYGLPNLPKAGFQRVALRPEDHRGGILTHASALSLSSDGTRHRPVHRGVWVSESIFGKPPNPPPANVDPIEPNPVNEPKATIRQKLKAHTEHASCSSCHKNIDPLGLAFDNYDAIGRWRTEEIVAQGRGKNPPVDASGQLPDGRPFSGPKEFKQLLLNNLSPFAQALTEKLATYALRRAMTIDDRDDIHAIAASCKDEGYRLRDLLESLVLSDLFLKR